MRRGDEEEFYPNLTSPPCPTTRIRCTSHPAPPAHSIRDTLLPSASTSAIG